MTTPFYTFKEYMKKTYGYPLYSIPIDLDFGCPNRKADGSEGCTFCPENGARAAQTLDAKSIEEQIQKGVSFAKNRYKAEKFMLYIQAYTGTFTSVINQKEAYSKLLNSFNFDAISIGTRPDCLNTQTLNYLKELNETIDVHIDLGVQTLKDDTLRDINRGHDSRCSLEAIKRIKEYGLKVFTHIIVGFKNETRDDWINTVKTLCKLDIDGIKIHNLHIIKNTQLHKEYEKKPFKTYTEYEYANELIYLIRHIPSHIPLIRISTDTPKEILIAPLWNMQKGQFSEYLNERMLWADFRQADLVEELPFLDTKKQNSFTLEDGSITVWDKKYKDYYHPKSGAFKQAKELFLKQSLLEEKLKTKDIHLLDIGFGMGYNSLEAMRLEKSNSLFITAIDKNRSIIKEASEFLESKNILEEIYETFEYKDKKNSLKLILDDARYALTTLDKKFDIIFLDSFIHNLNPSLITVEFIALIKKVLKDDGVLVCSQNIDSLKSALSLNGFKYISCDIDKTDIKGLKAIFGKSFNETLPYEDKHLILREKQIVTNREEALARLS